MAVLYTALRLVHVLGAALWLGGAAFHLLVVMKATRAAGPAAGPFLGTVLRQGGFGRFYGPVSVVTVAAGLYLYVDGGFADDPFGSGPAAVLTVGVVAAVAAFLEGLLVQMPLERRMRREATGGGGPPSPEAQARLAQLGAKAGRAGVLSVALLLVAFLAMAGRGLAA